jgi:Flp pilus assembly protein TadD
MKDSNQIHRLAHISPEIVAGVSAFCCLGLAPGLTWFDAGELMAASAELGITHPPGMPIFAMIHKAVSLIVPMGDIAFRGNLASALLSAVAVALACRIGLRLKTKILPTTIGAFAAVMSPLFLLHTTAVEVYSGLALLTFWSLDLVLAGHATKDRRHWVAAALVLGLGIGGHHSEIRLFSILLMLPILLRYRQLRVWTSMALAGITGVMVALYLPIRSLQEPWRNWGDPSNFSNMWDHLWGARIRAAYGEQMGQLDWTTVTQFSEQVATSTPILFSLGMVGLIMAVRKHAGWLPLAIVLLDILYSILVNPMGVRDQQNGLITVILCGVGLSLSLTWFLDRYGQSKAVYWCVSLLVVAGAIASFQGYPCQTDRGLEKLLSAADDKIPAEGLTLVASDHFASGWAYRQVVEGARPDMAVVVRQHVSYASSTEPSFRRLPQTLAGWKPGVGLGALTRLNGPWPKSWEWAQGLDGHNRPQYLKPAFPMFQNSPGSSYEFTSELKAWSQQLPDGQKAAPIYNAAANLATDIGSYLLTEKMYNAALEHLRWATEISPHVHSRWTNLGAGLSAVGQTQAAINVTRHALSLRANDRIALSNLGRYHIRMSDWKRALAVLDRLLLNPKGALPYGLRGVVMANQGDFDEARKMFKKALAINPNQPESRAGMAQLKRMQPQAQ